MRILFISHYFAPDSGAAANRLTRLAKMLQARGHAVTVLTTVPHYPTGIVADSYRAKFSVEDDLEGIRVIHVNFWATSSSAISRRLLSQVSFMLTCALRGIFLARPDVIFIENQPIFTGLAGWFISRVKRVPYVLNVSDYWPEYLVAAGVAKETSRTYRLFKALANLTQRSAGRIAIMWDGLAEGIQRRIPSPPPLRLIYNAVDLHLFKPQSDSLEFREKYGFGSERLITFLGVLGSHIDLETMFTVAEALNQREDVRVLIVGTGAQKEKLLHALKRPELSRLRWIEWLDYSEVPNFWAASYLHFWAVQPNELDKLRFQAKLFEALATGTPTVIAVEGLMSKILAESGAGFTVAPHDAPALVASLERLLDDEALYQQMSQNGRNYALQHFEPEKTTSAYEELLKELIR